MMTMEELIKVFIFIVTSFALIIIPIFLPLGFSPDSLAYYMTINTPPDRFDFLLFEPFYWLIVYVNQILFDGSWISFLLFFSSIYVILSVYLIKKYFILPIVSFVMFIFLYYPNFGLIQIRNGVAIAFIWWAFFDLVENKRWKFIIKIVIAILFHYSSIIAFLLLFINKHHINKKFYFLLPLAGFFLGQYVLDFKFYQLIIDYLPIFLKFKVQNYLHIVMHDPHSKLAQINIINAFSLFTLIIYYLNLIIIHPYDKHFITLEKILGLGIFFWFAFKAIAVFSFRISNIPFSFIVFLVPHILKNFEKENRFFILYLLFLISFLLSFNMYVRHELFNFSLLKK